MRTVFKPSVLAVSIVTALASTSVMATNGLAPTGLGQIHKAMGGAAVGNPINTTSIMTNPAAASFVDDGWDAGVELFVPDRETTITGNAAPSGVNGTYDGNKRDTFLIPEFGYKKSISNKAALAIVAYGNGGMNATYDRAVPLLGNGSTGTTGIDFAQVFISPTAAWKVTPNHSIGLSLNLVAQQFKARGIENFDNANFSSNPGSLSSDQKDTSTGVGATVGWQGKLSSRVTGGVSYRSEVTMGKLNKYSGLFPNAGRLNVPAALTVGLGVKVSPKTTVAVDVERIYYGSLDSIGNSPSKLFAGVKLGAPDGPGFGWEDQDIFKIGVKHQYSPKLALMAGYNHGDAPIKSSDTLFNILAPATSEDHLSLGVEWALNSKSKIIGSYVHTFDASINGSGSIPAAFGGGEANLSMVQNAAGIAYSHKF